MAVPTKKVIDIEDIDIMVELDVVVLEFVIDMSMAAVCGGCSTRYVRGLRIAVNDSDSQTCCNDLDECESIF